jgi:hypothetical protein
MSVIILPEVLEYLDNVAFILFEKEYFSYLDTSILYVDDLIDNIKATLPDKRHRRAPAYYAKYGRDVHYASFKKNRRTTWYAFFTKYEVNGKTVYLVRYIGNNHTEAHHLYEGFTGE